MRRQQGPIGESCRGVLTRPAPLDPNPLRFKLMNQGLLCHIPVIKLEATEQGAELAQKIWRNIHQDQQPLMLLLTSPSAADFLGQAFDQTLSQEQKHHLQQAWRHTAIACVGEKTRQRFRQSSPKLGEPGQWLLPPAGQEEGRHLAQVILSQRAEPFHGPITILHPTGDKKSGDWAAWLEGRGNRYERWVLYHNRPNNQAQNSLKQKLGLAVDWLFFSPSAVDALLELTGGSAFEQTGWRAFGIGSVTAQRCRDRGFALVYRATQAEETVLLQEYLDIIKGEGPPK